MKKILSSLALILSAVLFAQNSAPYENTSIIKLLDVSESTKSSLLEFNVNSLACRHDDMSSELIVSQEAINWLETSGIAYKTIVSNLKEKIDHDNAVRAQIANQKDGEDWYNVYRTFDEIQEKIDLIASTYSIATEVYLGDSYEGNQINGLKLSTGGSGKPAVFFNGCQHAREWISPMATVYLADFLCQNNEIDVLTQSVLDSVDVYIVPVVNPDGYIYSHTDERYWRKNRQPNAGNSCVGTDLNRNWDADWAGPQSTSTDPCSDVYVGTEAFSATEANVVKNYMEGIPNMVGHVDIHSYSALVLGAWGYSNAQSPDHAAIVELGNAMNDAMTNTHNYNFTFGTGDADGAIYLASGTMPDWSYDALGALGYTYELRPATSSEGGFELPIDQILDACEENYNGSFQMILSAANISAGCTNPEACNYDSSASVDDGSCEVVDECGDCGGNGPAPGYDCEGNCISGDLINISMNDTYGDGWNGNELLINGVAHTFSNGYTASSSMCYDPNACSTVICGGGSWQEEVSWTITNSLGEELLSGGAPYEGEFGNCSGDVYGCTDNTALNYNAQATIDDGSCLYLTLDEQVIELPLGWYIFSSYIELSEPSIDSVLSAIAPEVVIAKDVTGLAYLPDWNYNGIGDVELDQGYLIKCATAVDLNLVGNKIQPETYVMNLSQGWNMFAYLRDTPGDLAEMLATIQDKIIIVKTYDGTAYLPDWGFNGIGNLNPGEGYQVKLSSDASFTYPAND